MAVLVSKNNIIDFTTKTKNQIDYIFNTTISHHNSKQTLLVYRYIKIISLHSNSTVTPHS